MPADPKNPFASGEAEITVPVDLDAKRRVCSEGWGLKYPAVNIQREGSGEESCERTVVRTGCSVEVSGVKSGVNWEMG